MRRQTDGKSCDRFVSANKSHPSQLETGYRPRRQANTRVARLRCREMMISCFAVIENHENHETKLKYSAAFHPAAIPAPPTISKQKSVEVYSTPSDEREPNCIKLLLSLKSHSRWIRRLSAGLMSYARRLK